MELSYGQLEMTLSAHFRIHPDRIGTFRSRIRQLQRLDFPPDSKVGRGERLRYSATQLFQFIAALELINAGFTGGLAVQIVKDRWWNFACGFGLAFRHRRKNQFEKLTFIRIMNCTLADLQGRMERAEIPSVFVEDADSLQKILMRNDDRVTNSYVVLCASDIVLNVLDLIKRVAQIDNPIQDDELFDWHLREGGADGFFMRAEDGWFLDEVPSGDPPFFLYGDIMLLTHEEPQLVEKLVEHDAFELHLTQDEIELLQSHDLVEATATPRWSPLTERGKMVVKYLGRDYREETENGEHP